MDELSGPPRVRDDPVAVRARFPLPPAPAGAITSVAVRLTPLLRLARGGGTFLPNEAAQWWFSPTRVLDGPGCAPVVARFCCLKEPPNRNRSGARIPLNTATPFAVHQMLDRNSYVVTGTERAMMLIMDGDDGGNDGGGTVQLFGSTRRVSQSTILKKNSAFGGGRQQRGIVTRQRQRGPSEPV